MVAAARQPANDRRPWTQRRVERAHRPVVTLLGGILLMGIAAVSSARMAWGDEPWGSESASPSIAALQAELAAQQQEIARLRAALNDDASKTLASFDSPSAVAGSPEPCQACPGECHCCGGGWYAAAEMVLLQPRFSGFEAFHRQSAPPRVDSSGDYAYDYDASFSLFLGYASASGYGLRSQWWKLEQQANPITLAPSPGERIDTPLNMLFAGDVLLVSQSLTAETIDLEMTTCVRAGGGHFVFGFGPRYVRLETDTWEQNVGGSLDRFDNAFHGLGPTLAAEYLCPLGSSGWAVHANSRVTAAIGSLRTSAMNNGRFVAASAQREAISISELELALQWERSGWHLRAGWQVQFWSEVIRVVPDLGLGADRADLMLHGFLLQAGRSF